MDNELKKRSFQTQEDTYNHPINPRKRWLITYTFIVAWWFLSCILSFMLVMLLDWFSNPHKQLSEPGVVACALIISWFVFSILGTVFLIKRGIQADHRDVLFQNNKPHESNTR